VCEEESLCAVRELLTPTVDERLHRKMETREQLQCYVRTPKPRPSPEPTDWLGDKRRLRNQVSLGHALDWGGNLCAHPGCGV